MLRIAKPPAKESIANNPDSLATIFFDFGLKVLDIGFKVFFVFFLVCLFL